MNDEKKYKSESTESTRLPSYTNRLSAQAKIIISLVKKQPQTVCELCKSAGISEPTWYRNRWILERKEIVRQFHDGWALSDYTGPLRTWNRLKQFFRKIGFNLAEVGIKRAIYDGREIETGWRKFRHDKECSIKGFVILRKARALLEQVENIIKIHLKFEYDGLILTLESIGEWDHLLWNEKVYEVRDVEQQLDSDYSEGCQIGKFVELPRGGKEGEYSHSKPRKGDSRSQVRSFLISTLNEAKAKGSYDSANAAFCVIYTNPNYTIMKEFTAPQEPINGVYAVGEPETVPIISAATQTPYAYEEHVPIHIFTIDKTNIIGSKLRWTMEKKLKRICDEHSIEGARVRLERRSDKKEQLNGKVLYSANFMVHYKRSASN